MNQEMKRELAMQWAWRLKELLEDEVGSAGRERFEAFRASCSKCRTMWEKTGWMVTALVRGAWQRRGRQWAPRDNTPRKSPGTWPPRLCERWGSAGVFLAAVAAAVLALWSERMASLRAPVLITGRHQIQPDIVAPRGTLCEFPVVFPVSGPGNRLGGESASNADCQAEWASVMVQDSKPLRAANDPRVPQKFYCPITCSGCGESRIVGLEAMGLDRIGREWNATIFAGRAPSPSVGRATMRLARGPAQKEWTSRTLIGSGHERIPHPKESASVAAQGPAESGIDFSAQGARPDDPASLLARALSVFQNSNDRSIDTDRVQSFGEAAAVLCQVLRHPDATAEQRKIAGFYRSAALSKARLHREAMEAAQWWMDEFNGRDDEIMLHIMGSSHWELGERERGREFFERIIEVHPATPFRPAIETLLKDAVFHPAAVTQSRTKPPLTSDNHAREFIANQRNGYLVIEVGLAADNPAHGSFRTVAERVSRLHHAARAAFDGQDFDQLRAVIAQHHPRYVLFVIPPESLDVNFQRQVFLLSPTLDDDLMADFAWGYLTARDGAAVNRLWDRIETLHRQGLANRHWVEVAVVGGGAKSLRMEEAVSALTRTAGFETTTLYLGLHSNDPDVLAFIDANLPELERAAVISLLGNGDPQGIWLFDDRRNADRSKHWRFDPAKVGHDPQGELVRLKADRFRALNLNGPIIWSGTCHSGACRRVFVERDIVATFGSSDQIELYEMEPDESLCLALIDAGAGALLVPIGSNHGMAATMEQQFALQHGASLGDAIKSTYDDVLFQAGGPPAIKIVKAGESAYKAEPIMQGGGANRILIGDPALKLFAPTPVPGETTTLKWDRESNELVVTVHWEKGFHATGWNMYGENRAASYRVQTRVELDAGLAAIFGGAGRPLAVSCIVTDDSQHAIDCHPRCAVECHAGQTFLHLQADMNRDTNYQSSFTAAFRIGAEK